MLYAARNGCYDCVEEMIAAGADVNVPTPEGVTPLMIALDNEHNEVAKLLLDQGADPNVWDWWGRTALYIAVDRKEAVAGEEDGWRGGGGAAADGRWGEAVAVRGPGRAFPAWTSSTPCWPRVSIPIRAQYASSQPGRQQRTLS